MNPLIELSGVNMFRGERQVLTDVNMTVGQGDFIAITGPNGGGKTTLLRIILKLIKPTAGRVTYTGRFNIGYLPQKNSVDSRFPMSVIDMVSSGLLGLKDLRRDERTRLVGDAIATVSLSDCAAKSIGQLSGGQLQRALLARALVSNPEVLILDEPLSYLDKKMESQVYEIVGDLKGRTTILLVSHEMSTIATLATRHLIVDQRVTECHSAHHAVHYDCGHD